MTLYLGDSLGYTYTFDWRELLIGWEARPHFQIQNLRHNAHSITTAFPRQLLVGNTCDVPSTARSKLYVTAVVFLVPRWGTVPSTARSKLYVTAVVFLVPRWGTVPSTARSKLYVTAVVFLVPRWGTVILASPSLLPAARGSPGRAVRESVSKKRRDGQDKMRGAIRDLASPRLTSASTTPRADLP